MKIGIITQPLNHNYGGIIQNFALQHVLKCAGLQVETINHHIKPPRTIKFHFLKFLELLKGIRKKNKALNYKLTNDEKAIIERNLLLFINKYLSLSETIESVAGFSFIDNKQRYDGYIVGSDQCWRPRYNKGYLDCMYLGFVNRDVKRIAYAVSFGADVWEYTPEQTQICSELVKKFNLVTVREDSGINLCSQYLGVKAIQVLDPTLLLTKEDYIKLIEEEKEPKSKGTLFNYILDPTKAKTMFVERIESETGLFSFQVLPKYHSTQRTKDIVKNHIEDCVYPTVTEWLRAFYDAEMTIVDSFHGMVFSIIFNKPFWVIGNINRGLSRFSSLLKMLNLEKRLIDESYLSSIDINEPIDWNTVNEIILSKKQESINWLIKEINNA